MSKIANLDLRRPPRDEGNMAVNYGTMSDIVQQALGQRALQPSTDPNYMNAIAQYNPSQEWQRMMNQQNYINPYGGLAGQISQGGLAGMAYGGGGGGTSGGGGGNGGGSYGWEQSVRDRYYEDNATRAYTVPTTATTVLTIDSNSGVWDEPVLAEVNPPVHSSWEEARFSGLMLEEVK